jgi:hypothetical protein
MKTVVDIENMKKQDTKIFDNAYSYLIEMLADYYISKNDGEVRIKKELNNWDSVAQEVILLDLKNCVETSNIKFIWK